LKNSPTILKIQESPAFQEWVSMSFLLVSPARQSNSCFLNLFLSDCLAAMLKEKLPNASHLELAFSFSETVLSAGTTKSMVAGLRNPSISNKARVNHELVEVPPFYKVKEVHFLEKGKRLVGFIPWGDTYTAYIR
jgi:short subunit dehydrogenase-like uncharacterized protein